MQSWGYLRDRCHHLGRNINKELSKLVQEHEKTVDFNEEITNSEMKIKGRIILDVWRLLRHEVELIFCKIFLYLILSKLF